MSVTLQEDTIFLAGDCPAQDAATLAELLIQRRSRSVDASGCTSMHGAVLQVFLAFTPHVQSMPDDPAMRRLFWQALRLIE